MIADLDLYGVFIPTLLLIIIGCYIVFRLAHYALARVGFYRLVWHPALFDVALYVVLLGASVHLFQRVTA